MPARDARYVMTLASCCTGCTRTSCVRCSSDPITTSSVVMTRRKASLHFANVSNRRYSRESVLMQSENQVTAPAVDVRKTVINIETIHHEGGPPVNPPLRVGVAAAVIKNPYAGRYVDDLLPFMDALKPLGVELSRLLLEAMGGDTTR